MRRLLGIGAVAGMLTLVLVVAALAVAVPFLTGSRTFSIVTSSMEPTYPPGTLIIVRPTDASALRVGDVITYQIVSDDPATITHRITAVEMSSNGTLSFTTMGDNNAAADKDAIQPGQIKGEVWYALPWIGALSTLRQHQVTAIALPIVGTALILWAAYLLISWVLGRRRPPRALERPQAVAAEEADAVPRAGEPGD